METDTTSVLHPRYKLTYFKTQCWEPTWIKTTESLVREELKRSYAVEVECLDSQEVPEAPTQVSLALSVLNQHLPACRRTNPSPTIFSMTCWISLYPQTATPRTKSLYILAPPLSQLRTSSLGGTKNERCTQCSHAWPSIICQYQVCHLLSFADIH